MRAANMVMMRKNRMNAMPTLAASESVATRPAMARLLAMITLLRPMRSESCPARGPEITVAMPPVKKSPGHLPRRGAERRLDPCRQAARRTRQRAHHEQRQAVERQRVQSARQRAKMTSLTAHIRVAALLPALAQGLE
jgi:hypothetical protein